MESGAVYYSAFSLFNNIHVLRCIYNECLCRKVKYDSFLKDISISDRNHSTIFFAAMNKNIRFSSSRTRSNRRARAGFSLIEMLVVITIITVMLSAGAIGLKNLSQTGGVSTAVPTAASIFSYARELAIGNGTRARVLINADQDDHEKYLRHILVAYEDEDEAGGARWITTARGSTIPRGVYFSQKYSFEEHSSASSPIPDEAMDLYASVASSAPNSRLSTTYFYYEFNAEGNALTPGASFVMNTGSKAPGKEFPRITKDSINGFGGFVIWKKGTTSSFRHPDQVGTTGNVSAGDEF